MVIDDRIPSSFSGAVSITEHCVPIFQNAYGYADIANEVPNAIETKFATASVGKVFTAVAILQLIERRVLSFDESIGDLLNIDLLAVDLSVTIRQLLSHTSGMPDYFDDGSMGSYEELWAEYPNYRIRKSADLLPLFINKPMRCSPGERFQYNDAGYVFLALIIEAVTNVPFDEYIKRSIFIPCTMGDTGTMNSIGCQRNVQIPTFLMRTMSTERTSIVLMPRAVAREERSPPLPT